MSGAGRACPLHYRYGAAAMGGVVPREAATLYVVGGLYGNLQALDAAEAMALAEGPGARLCFNGDFHWFDIADRDFAEVGDRVAGHDAILGNVEAELMAASDAAGCGCAYPETVDAGVVERSNRIHALLKSTAMRHPGAVAHLGQLPMFTRYRVGDCRVGVVHGDADSLAGWRFDVEALDDPHSGPWLDGAFAAAEVDLFASTHTCLPALRRFERHTGGAAWVANNGAAGMPNFACDPAGLCTRVATTPSPHPVLREVRVAGAFVALLPLRFDAACWRAAFLAQWPAGSPAWVSYFERICHGPAYTPERALAGAGQPAGARLQSVIVDTLAEVSQTHRATGDRSRSVQGL